MKWYVILFFFVLTLPCNLSGQIISDSEFEKYIERLDYYVYSYQVKKNWDLADSLETHYSVSDLQQAKLDFYKGVAILELGTNGDGLNKLNRALDFFNSIPKKYSYWILRTKIVQLAIDFFNSIEEFDLVSLENKVKYFEKIYPKLTSELNYYRLKLYDKYHKRGHQSKDSLKSLLLNVKHKSTLFDSHLNIFIGDYYHRRGNNSKAFKHLLSARIQMIDLNQEKSLLYAYLHRPLSASLKNIGNFSTAIYFFDLQKEISLNNQIKEYKNLMYLNALANLAIIAKNKRNFDKSISLYKEVQTALYPNSPDFAVNLGSDHLSNNHIAEVYLEKGQFHKAYWLINYAIDEFNIEKRYNNELKVYQVRAYYHSTLAKYHLLNNDVGSAINDLQPHVSKLEELNIENFRYSPIIFNVIAESYFVNGWETQCKKYLDKAISTNYSDEDYSNYQELFKSYNLLTRWYISKRDHKGLMVIIKEIKNTSIHFLNGYESYIDKESLFLFVGEWCDIIYSYLIEKNNTEEHIDILHELVEFQKGIGQFQKSIDNKQTQENNLNPDDLRSFVLKEEIFELQKKKKRISDSRIIDLQIDSLELQLMELGVKLTTKENIQFNPKRLDEIQEGLHNEAFINYFKVGEKLYAIKVNRHERELVELGISNDIENKVDSIRVSLYDYYLSCASHRKSLSFYKSVFDQNATSLYKQIVQPLEIKDHTTRLTISPIDKLNYIPFEILLKDDQFLLKDYAINYSPCESLKKSSEKNNKNKTVLFAPVFEEIQDTFCVSEQYRANYLGPIYYNENEVQNIEKIVGGDVLIENATLDNFNRLMNNANIIHLATHGKVDFLDDNFSFIAFKQDEEVPENKLFLKDLEFLSLDANCVVLSACESGLGKVYLGEGVKSMASSFLSAGVKSVISTLWSVNDRSTSMIMENFYTHLKNGMNKDVALQQAKLDYLAKVDPEYQHPFYWAGFVAIGDMSPLEFQNNNNLLWLLFLIPLGFVTWNVNQRRLRNVA